ncbi:MAG: hypothetical protein WAQ24_01435 [Candidatus Saccharimonadales bacterium]
MSYEFSPIPFEPPQPAVLSNMPPASMSNLPAQPVSKWKPPSKSVRSPKPPTQAPSEFAPHEPIMAMLGIMLAERLDQDGAVLPFMMETSVDMNGTYLQKGDFTTIKTEDYSPKSYTLSDGNLLQDPWTTVNEHNVVTIHKPSSSNSNRRLASYVMPLLQGNLEAIRKRASSTDLECATADAAKFRELLQSRGFEHDHGIGWQEGEALHFNKQSEQPENKDFSPLRVYVSSGVAAFGVAKSLLEDPNVDIDGGKIWYPLTDVRMDAPIFYVSSHKQLTSALQGLYNLKEKGDLAVYPSPYTLGRSIKGMDGVYVAQAASGESFNGTMGDLWGLSIIDAVRIHNLRAGERVTTAWYQQVARTAVQQAIGLAPHFGVSSVHHAFLADQPVDAILATIASVEAKNTC